MLNQIEDLAEYAVRANDLGDGDGRNGFDWVEDRRDSAEVDLLLLLHLGHFLD